MKQLILSEWERLWKRKTTWLLLCAIPVILMASATFLSKQNQTFTPDLPQYTVAWNFPVLGLSEMLITVFQGVIIIIVAFTVTEEYRTGQLRLVLIRSYSYPKIIFAKYTVTVGTVLLFFIIYFILSYLFGMFMFPAPDHLPLFFHEESVTTLGAFVYSLKFYGIACTTALAMVSVMFFIAVMSRTTTAAIGSGIGFLLFSLAYPNILSYFETFIGKAMYVKLFFTSIPMIQWQGITLMLAEHPILVGWNFSVIGAYTLLFAWLTRVVIQKKDIFI